MAGSYVDVPSWRMSWDRDGTQAYLVVNGVPSQLGQGTLTALNGEAGGQNLDMDDAGIWLTLIFPEPRDLDALFLAAYGNGSMPAACQVSTNTTNGVDGTWTGIGFSVVTTTGSGDIQPAYRTGITSTTALGIVAIRFQGRYGGSRTNRLKAVHLYGEPAPGENLKRLEIWHPTEDRRHDPAFFDWGNTPRASSGDKSFRVKNMSPASTAQDIRVAMEGVTVKNPSLPGQHVISLDGSLWLAQVNIGALAPGAISQVINLRRITATNAVLSVDTARLFAESQSWT